MGECEKAGGDTVEHYLMTLLSSDKIKLIDSSIKMVKALLVEQDEFYPIAHIINMDGKIENLSYFDGDENPESERLILKFIEIFEKKAENEEIRAGAIAYDVSVKRDSGIVSDTIAIKMIHIENPIFETTYYSYVKAESNMINIIESWTE